MDHLSQKLMLNPVPVQLTSSFLPAVEKNRTPDHLFIRCFRHTAPFSRFLGHAGDTEAYSRPPASTRGDAIKKKLANRCNVGTLVKGQLQD